MAADWWARGIALGGACVTAINVFLSFRTYRRMKPNLRVLVRNMVISYPTGDPGSGIKDIRHHFNLRLVNQSPTAVQIEQVSLGTPYLQDPKQSVQLEWHSYDPYLRIEPFSGDHSRLSVTEQDLEVGGRFADKSMKARLTITLADGRVVHSRWLEIPPRDLVVSGWPGGAPDSYGTRGSDTSRVPSPMRFRQTYGLRPTALPVALRTRGTETRTRHALLR